MVDSIERIAGEIDARSGNANGITPAELMGWATRLRALSPAGQQEPGAVELRLFDSQWVSIVNHANCYAGWAMEEAIAHAVKLTEQAMAKNVRDGKFPQKESSGQTTDAQTHCARCQAPDECDGKCPDGASGQTLAGAELTIAEYLDELATDPDPLDELDRRYIAEAAATIRRTATSAGTTGDDSEDAARYRWLRTCGVADDRAIHTRDYSELLSESALDAAIDARRAREVG